MQILNDFSTSVRKALEEIDPNYMNYEGLVICGSWPGDDDEKIVISCLEKLRMAKGRNTPVLGICLGMQVIGLSKGWELKKLEQRKIGIHKVNGWWGETYETFWHDYTVGQDFIREGNIIGVQFHPEYQSSKDKPHPLLVHFINLCKNV